MAEKTHKKSGKKAAGVLRLRWFRSAIQAPVKHKRVVRGLGFTHLNQIVEREDTPSIRGMVNKVPHLVEVVDGPEKSGFLAPRTRNRTPRTDL